MQEVNKMKKAFADPTLEPILFGFDVITSSGGGIVIGHKSEGEYDSSDDFGAVGE